MGLGLSVHFIRFGLDRYFPVVVDFQYPKEVYGSFVRSALLSIQATNDLKVHIGIRLIFSDAKVSLPMLLDELHVFRGEGHGLIQLKVSARVPPFIKIDTVGAKAIFA